MNYEDLNKTLTFLKRCKLTDMIPVCVMYDLINDKICTRSCDNCSCYDLHEVNCTTRGLVV